MTALPAIARLARPRELAQIMLFRFQNPKSRKRARIGGTIYLGLALLTIPFLWRSSEHQRRWLTMAILVGAVSAVEFILNSRAFSEEQLSRQNRSFGAVYASIAIAVALLLLTR